MATQHTKYKTVYFGQVASTAQAPTGADPNQKASRIKSSYGGQPQTSQQIGTQKAISQFAGLADSFTDYDFDIGFLKGVNVTDIIIKRYTVFGLSCNPDDPFAPEKVPNLECKVPVSSRTSFIGDIPIDVFNLINRSVYPLNDPETPRKLQAIYRKAHYLAALDASQQYISNAMQQRNTVGAGYRGGAPGLCSGNVEYPYISNSSTQTLAPPRAAVGVLRKKINEITVDSLRNAFIQSSSIPDEASGITRCFPIPNRDKGVRFPQPVPCYFYLHAHGTSSLGNANVSGRYGHLQGKPLSFGIGCCAQGPRFATVSGSIFGRNKACCQ